LDIIQSFFKLRNYFKFSIKFKVLSSSFNSPSSFGIQVFFFNNSVSFNQIIFPFFRANVIQQGLNSFLAVGHLGSVSIKVFSFSLQRKAKSIKGSKKILFIISSFSNSNLSISEFLDLNELLSVFGNLFNEVFSLLSIFRGSKVGSGLSESRKNSNFGSCSSVEFILVGKRIIKSGFRGSFISSISNKLGKFLNLSGSLLEVSTSNRSL